MSESYDNTANNERTTLFDNTPLKRCSRCKELKEFDQYSSHDNKKDGLYCFCKPCAADYRREYQRTPKARIDRRGQNLKKKYKIDESEFEAMLFTQKGVCAICGQKETVIGGRTADAELPLSVDHDHQTGEVRGLLCHQCNHGLGNFQDNMNLLLQAMAYLLRYKKFADPERKAE